jgi:hypothetical protein
MAADAAQVTALDLRVGSIGSSALPAFRSTFAHLRSFIL